MNAAARLVSAGLVLAVVAACQGATVSTPSPAQATVAPTGSPTLGASPIATVAGATPIQTTTTTLEPIATPTQIPSPTPTFEPTPSPTAEPTPGPAGLVIDWGERGGEHGFGRLYDDSTSPTFHSGAVFANRYFIAGAQEDEDFNDSAAVWSSADGLTWELANIPGLRDVHAMAANDAGLLVVAESSARTELWLTTNGTDWEPIAVSDDPEQYVYHVEATPAGFVAFGSAAWTSIDGVSWAPMIEPSAIDLAAASVGKIVSFGERLVALTGGSGGGPLMVWTSTNLVDWTMAGALAGTRNIHDPIVAGGPLGWIVAGYDEGREQHLMFASTDGLSWQQVTPAIGPVSDVFIDQAGFVAVGFLYVPMGCDADPSEIQGLTWTSTDGRSWTAMPLDEFLHKRIDHLFRDGRTLIGIGLGYEEDSGTAFDMVWTAQLPAVAPPGPGPTPAPTPTPDPGGCGPG